MTPLLLTGLLLLGVQGAPEKASPFTAVRWEGDVPSVQFEGEWYGLVSLDGVTREKLVEFCKNEYGDRWKKRFSEDLVEVLKKMGQTPKASALLVMSKDGASVTKTGAMTEENRRKVMQGDRAAGEAPARPGREKAPAAAVDRSKLYDFEAARIVYRYSGAFEGTETFSVAEHGKILLLQRDKKIGVWDRNTTYWKDGKATHLDPAKKTWFVSAIKTADMDLSVLHAVDDGLKLVGLLRKGNEEVAGKTCVLYEKKDGDALWRSWRWKGIELKIEMKNFSGLSYVKEATSVEEGIAIPAELLKVPDGFTPR